MTARPDKTPNFFIAGAPKAGTDALYYELAQHPDVYMSPLKEPCYFSSEIRPVYFVAELQDGMRERARLTKQYLEGNMRERRFGGIVSEWNDYLRLFQGCGREKAVGEGSVCYLWSKSAASAIASRLPHSKIIIVLMDPAERAFAQYRKSVSQGHVRETFRRHLERAFEDPGDRFSLFHPFLEFGRYAPQIKRYLDVFPREQILISFYEDAREDYARWFDRILAFLGVSKTSSAVRFEAHESGEAEPMVLSPEDRALLVEYYRNDIGEVEDLVGRKLAAWLR